MQFRNIKSGIPLFSTKMRMWEIHMLMGTVILLCTHDSNFACNLNIVCSQNAMKNHENMISYQNITLYILKSLEVLL